jgi:hypothetical protein
MEEYQKIVSNNIQDFDNFCDQVGKKAQERGLTETELLEILADE